MSKEFRIVMEKLTQNAADFAVKRKRMEDLLIERSRAIHDARERVEEAEQKRAAAEARASSLHAKLDTAAREIAGLKRQLAELDDGTAANRIAAAEARADAYAEELAALRERHRWRRVVDGMMEGQPPGADVRAIVICGDHPYRIASRPQCGWGAVWLDRDWPNSTHWMPVYRPDEGESE